MDEVHVHLVLYGMDRNYTTWFHHGEDPVKSQNDNADLGAAYELFMASEMYTTNTNDSGDKNSEEDFRSVLADAECQLYEGCSKYSKLSSIMELYNLKTKHGWSDTSFNDLLELIEDMLPENNVLLTSMYLVNKFLRKFNLNYTQIHACVNDCCLFTKENADAQLCPKCQTPRWKENEHTKEIITGQAAKVLRYFPIIPRLQRMFRIEKTAKNLRWHSSNKSTDGKMRHPVDSEAWNAVDERWPEFSLEPNNLRLGLAADGINPYKNMSSTYSCWPVMLVVYNLPPSLCMKDEFTFLSMLIPGPKQPGNDIDIYLQPLIDELQELWRGVYTYDASEKKFFNMRAMLLWTINDFPAYGNLAGCATKGRYACPLCGENTDAHWLKHSRKMSYCNHIRFLPKYHPYRKKKFTSSRLRNKAPPCPTIPKDTDVAEQLLSVVSNFGKGRKKRSRDEEEDSMWKKKSVFFSLPYWEVLVVRHNLDVMHVEKNVCESIINTLLDCKGKSKDHYQSRLDLQDMGIMPQLHPYEEDNITRLPPATYTLSKSEKKLFCKRLFDLKLPYGYSSKISNCVDVEKHKLIGLKSHDCHVLMQQLLAVAIRGIMEEGPRVAILRLSKLFYGLCQHVVDKEEIVQLELEAAEILCKLEDYFPPSFFDPMIHLVVHLPREVRLCGPVQFRWMYHFER